MLAFLLEIARYYSQKQQATSALLKIQNATSPNDRIGIIESTNNCSIRHASLLLGNMLFRKKAQRQHKHSEARLFSITTTAGKPLYAVRMQMRIVIIQATWLTFCKAYEKSLHKQPAF